ncbi:hypothetical protein V7S76_12900 [Aquirufa sp. ROCK2-A2]
MFELLKSNYRFALITSLILWAAGIYSVYFLQLSPFPWEFKYHLLGNKLNQGFQLYAEIKDNTSPFSALFYRLLGYLSIPISWNIFIAAAIVGIQAWVFQQTLGKHHVLPRIGLIPMIIYLLTFHLSFEFFVPTPALIGLTFLLLAWREITSQQTRIQTNDGVFFIGIFIGIASIFYLSYTIFIFWALLSLIFYTGITIRQVLLTFVGYLFVVVLTAIVFMYNGNLTFMLEVFKKSAFSYQAPNIRDWQQIFIVFSPAIVFGLLGLWGVSRSKKIKAHAQKVFQSNLIFLLFSILSIFTLPSLSRANLVFIMPCMVLFGLNTFYIYRENWKKELIFWALIIGTAVSLNVQFSTKDLDRLTNNKLKIRNEKLMVLGPQIEEYQANIMVGPFINWELSQFIFSGINEYKNVISISDFLQKDTPSYIYDPTNKFQIISRYLPQINNQYQLIEPNLYKRIK